VLVLGASLRALLVAIACHGLLPLKMSGVVRQS
jgi:hypothetical protein